MVWGWGGDSGRCSSCQSTATVEKYARPQSHRFRSLYLLFSGNQPKLAVQTKKEIAQDDDYEGTHFCLAWSSARLGYAVGVGVDWAQLSPPAAPTHFTRVSKESEAAGGGRLVRPSRTPAQPTPAPLQTLTAVRTVPPVICSPAPPIKEVSNNRGMCFSVPLRVPSQAGSSRDQVTHLTG